jgi:hypothetical protein
MFQWIIRGLITLMGWVYVILDSMLKHPPTPVILGVDIDEDFQGMTRRELCNHIEKRFDLGHDRFWNEQSTSKIRLGCQLARNVRNNK